MEKNAATIIQEWGPSYHEGGQNTLFVKRLREQLNDEQIAYVLTILDGICQQCWDSDAGCQCWNDE